MRRYSGAIAALVVAAAFFAATAFAAETCRPYDRSDWPVDKNTRQEVLIAESLEPTTLEDNCRCVKSGTWLDAYTGQLHTHPGDLEIDHRVPLREAYDSGGYAWNAAKRRAYANDLRDPEHLVAVASGVNSSKYNKDPAEWLPPAQSERTAYARAWIAVKLRWGLSADDEEAKELRELLEDPDAVSQLKIEPETRCVKGFASKDASRKCCKFCKKGRACGDACLPRGNACSKPSGCACQEGT